jgi:hypothetical protein
MIFRLSLNEQLQLFVPQSLPFSVQLKLVVYLLVDSEHPASFPTVQLQTLLPAHLLKIQQGPIVHSVDRLFHM